jgi:hypothetical protein
VETAVGRILAVQGQDPRGFRLAIRARTSGVTAADVDRALTEERSIVVSWLNRGTLHLVRAEDYPWLHALTTPQLATGNALRLRQEGVDRVDRGVALITKALADGPKTRADIAHVVRDVTTNPQGVVHLLLRATIDGRAVRGPVLGKEQAFVVPEDWLRPQPRVDLDRALTELAVRYLRGHAPAGPEDLAKWAGIPLNRARAAFAAVPGGPATGAPATKPALLPPRLLGSFDPVLHGWASREWLLPVDDGVVTSNGIFRPTALVGGRVVATWTLSGTTLGLQPLEPVDPDTRRQLEADAQRLGAYLGIAKPLHVQ